MLKTFQKKFLFLIIIFSLLSGCREYAYFLDMHYSPAVDAQEKDIIGNRKGNFIPPEGSVPYKTPTYNLTNDLNDYIKADITLKDPFKMKKLSGRVLSQGQEQYRIYCSPCHGLSGRGDGTIKAKWSSIRPLVEVDGQEVPPLKWGLGRIYHVIRVGIRSMQGYESQITEENRWAIAHYVKYLQSEIAIENKFHRQAKKLTKDLTDKKTSK